MDLDEQGGDGRPRVALVLGGGGFPAMAHQAGTLLALATDFGWDARTADVVVGTSAGSMVAALLRAGVAPADLAAWASAVAAEPDGSEARAAIDRLGEIGLGLALPRPRVGLRSARSLHGWALSTLNPGFLEYTTALGQIADLLGEWPERPTLITAVRASDGRRIAFGDEERPPITAAIAASTAIPALFRPVRIGDHRYVDGGVHSPTNADLVADLDVDVALIVSSMTVAQPDRTVCGRLRMTAPLRAWARRRLAAEVTVLERAGLPVVVVHASSAASRAMGWNGLGRDRIGDIVSQSYLDFQHVLDPAARRALVPLAARAR